MEILKSRTIKWIAAIIVLLGLIVVHFYIPRFITEIKNPIVGVFKKNDVKIKIPAFEDNRLNGKYINFHSFDSTKISGYLTYSSIDSIKGTIILLHGIRSNKEHFINLSKRLAALGYNSVALDLRAHGSSEGVHCTFGVKEKLDIKKLVSYLVHTEKMETPIGIWGQSLGGAIALQAMAIDKRIGFGIIESTFSDFRTVTHDYFRYHLGFNIPFFTNYLIDRAGAIADFNPDDAIPGEMAKEIEQRILIVHGNKDDRINIKYGKLNFNNIASKQKEFLEVENADHLNVWNFGGEKYFENAIFFIVPK